MDRLIKFMKTSILKTLIGGKTRS